MPTQTTLKQNVYFPDGAKVEYSTDGSSFSDLGAIGSAVTGTLNYEVNEVITANAGTLQRQAKNPTLAAGFTLININPSNIADLSGGMLTAATTNDSANTSVPDQVISSGDWAKSTAVPLVMYTSSTDSTPLRASAAPTLTDVEGSEDGTLSAGTDYEIIEDSSSFSGYSIVLLNAITTLAQDITIDYASVTPIERTTVTGGASTTVMETVALRFTHTDDDSLVRQLTIYAADVDSGGFQFNFKGANEDGVEEMPLTFTGKLDTSRTSGDQLFSFIVDDGAA